MEKNMKIIATLLVLFLSACSNNIPRSIQTEPSNDIQLRRVLYENSGYFFGEQVRWGGKIISVNNDGSDLILEIRHYPLNRYGFPMQNHVSQGRFIGRTAPGIETDEYQQGMLITFVGIINAEETKLLYRKEQVLPIIDIEATHLWPYSISNGKAYSHSPYEYSNRNHGYIGSTKQLY